MATEQSRGRRGDRVVDAEMTTAPVDTIVSAPEARETTVRNVTQVATNPLDRVRWGPIWAGLLTALFVLLVLGLFGVAIGLTTINAGAAATSGLPATAGQYSATWAGISAIIAFLIGGYVAGRTAAVHERGWAALNGALVFLLALPIILWLATQGLGAIIGNTNGIASGLGINLGQLGSAVHNPTPGQATQAASAVKTTAWGTLIGLIVGLVASALGGTIGARRAPRLSRPVGIGPNTAA